MSDIHLEARTIDQEVFLRATDVTAGLRLLAERREELGDQDAADVLHWLAQEWDLATIAHRTESPADSDLAPRRWWRWRRQ